MKRVINDVTDWTKKITNWLHGGCNRPLFYLSSCGQPNAASLGAYELIVGVGVKRCLVVEDAKHFDTDIIREFLEPNAWNFFCLSYDLNKVIAGTSHYACHDELQWPLVCLVEPEEVITLSRSGELDIFSPHPEATYATIQSCSGSWAGPALSVDMGVSRRSMTAEEHHKKVETIRNEIAKGNMYEMNLCMETTIDDIVISDSLGFHRELLEISPTPFSSYVQFDGFHLMCASPERYLLKSENNLYSQPIKGTSGRFDDPCQDSQSKDYLANSMKERAEHIMIVDLVRNDLGRLAETGSVNVEELCAIYAYRQVFQMISTISCKLRDNVDFWNVVESTFPMGSMTGAPKQIVMDYIGKLETVARGWFSGSVGYIKPDRDFDSNVVIRSVLYDENKRKARFSVGGAITYDSDPIEEYRECLLKSSAIRHLFERYQRVVL